MRVLLVADVSGRDDEGMKKIARELARALQEEGSAEATVVSNLQVFWVTGRVDVIHFTGGPTLRTLLIARLAKLRHPRSKIVVSFTNALWDKACDVVARWLGPDLAIVSTRAWKEHMETLGVPVRLTFFSAVDRDRFRPVQLRQPLRERYGMSQRIIALHVGHLKEDRNLEALCGLASSPDIEVVIVGSTTTRASDAVVARLQRCGCRILRGYQRAIEELYQAADVYVFPTTDPRAAVDLPLSVLEAMACGLPVITTPFGGLPDFFESGPALRFAEGTDGFRPEDVLNIAEERGRNLAVVASRDWQRLATTMAELYRQLVGGAA